MHVSRLKSLGVAAALGLVLVGASEAQDGHDHGAGPHGGTLEMTKHYHFEVVLTAAGLKVYPYGMDGKPLDAAKMSGTVTFYHPNSPQPWFNRPLSAPGQVKEPLDCTINLIKAPAKGAKATFEVAGLPDTAEPSASFAVPFTLTQSPPAATVRPAPAAFTFASASRADQPAIQAQRVCAVTGKSLGSMGTPLKVTRGDRSVFLCCQGCLAKVTANPDQYFGAVR